MLPCCCHKFTEIYVRVVRWPNRSVSLACFPRRRLSLCLSVCLSVCLSGFTCPVELNEVRRDAALLVAKQRSLCASSSSTAGCDDGTE